MLNSRHESARLFFASLRHILCRWQLRRYEIAKSGGYDVDYVVVLARFSRAGRGYRTAVGASCLQQYKIAQSCVRVVLLGGGVSVCPSQTQTLRVRGVQRARHFA